MRYLFNEWRKIKRKTRGRYLFIFLDYDGTLTPIVNTPDKAVIPKENRDLLRDLSRNSRCKIAIISGRSLQDIKSKINLNNIIYVGNHGLEIDGQKIKHINTLSIKYRVLIGQIKKELQYRLSSIKGVILEDKGLSLTVHYRLVRKKEIPSLRAIFHEVTKMPLLKKMIKVKSGKMIFEISPPLEWNKGKAVLWLLYRQKFSCNDKAVMPIYIGDDNTDEDAFKALNKRGLTIFVGKPRSSYAKYYLKNTKEVIYFLKHNIIETLCQS